MLSTTGTIERPFTSPANGILVVEDEKIVAKDIQRTLSGLGYSVVGIASSGEEAVRKSAELRPGLILMDIRLGGAMNGIQAAGLIREQLNAPIVYVTAFSDSETLARAMSAEPFGYIVKPFKETDLRSTIELALYKHSM